MLYGRRLPTALATATAGGALLLSACGSDSSGAEAGDDRLNVVASFYPLRYLAEQIGGEHVEVTDLTAAGVEPHDLELTARQVGAVQQADAVLYLKGLQPTVDKAVAQSHSRHVIDATAAAPLVDHHLDSEDHDGHSHADAAGDPHLWLDPTRYAAVAAGVGSELAAADPAHAADYRQNADALVEKLGDLDREFHSGLNTCAGKAFVTSHAAFGYLADRYGLEQIAINGVDPESEPTPARLGEIQRAAKAHGVGTVFFETSAGPKLASTVAQDLNLRTAVLDPIEGVREPAADDYFSIMRQNLTALRTALSCST
ncbi:zinc ABC transporter substrate-binding protein [Kitasatospora sp. MAA4]|uniref:metal ABC transporter solute-binding protein, Zn/Mn family n=1 Tax=Kitasatospora sp. MAA4 TaxID=3035093 RepID=UPI00247403EC|nr:zinc ABC transporter substrate-binding protein [Kitasatospora sp. MAA4]